MGKSTVVVASDLVANDSLVSAEDLAEVANAEESVTEAPVLVGTVVAGPYLRKVEGSTRQVGWDVDAFHADGSPVERGSRSFFARVDFDGNDLEDRLLSLGEDLANDAGVAYWPGKIEFNSETGVSTLPVFDSE